MILPTCLGLLVIASRLAAAESDLNKVPAVDKRDHWAFKAPTRLAPPGIKDRSWPKNPIDQFILSRLEKEGLQPSPGADRGTLLRRLSLDLIGLPPTIEEVDAFLADRSPDAWQQQV